MLRLQGAGEPAAQAEMIGIVLLQRGVFILNEFPPLFRLRENAVEIDFPYLVKYRGYNND